MSVKIVGCIIFITLALCSYPITTSIIIPSLLLVSAITSLFRVDFVFGAWALFFPVFFFASLSSFSKLDESNYTSPEKIYTSGLLLLITVFFIGAHFSLKKWFH